MLIVWGLKSIMIDKLKQMYPDYLIFIKRKNKLYDLFNKEVINTDILRRYSYIIVDENSYEVHPKINDKVRQNLL